MIFVAVGTQKFQLNRLLEKIDVLKGDGLIKDEIFAQTGNSDYIPKNYEYKKFLEKHEYEKVICESNLIITHSGVGTIITGITNNKPVIVFPRLAKFREHVDDHQLEIAEAFSKKNFVYLCCDENKLVESIENAKRTEFSKYVSNQRNVVDIVRNYINNN